ncbi:MAG: ThiF family adenylyltransferase [Oscillospiraceae bacterium]
MGSYAAEALVRSGLGTLYIYDNDTVAKSNINRQLIALNSPWVKTRPI